MIILENNQSVVDLAAKELLASNVIALPTDTVYGLATIANDADAVDRLYEIKGRDPKKPFAILVKNLAKAEEFLEFNDKSRELAKKFLPGKLTMVLRTKKNWREFLAENLNQNSGDKILPEIGFRVIASNFLDKFFAKYPNKILALTSANISGEEVAKTAKEIAGIFPKILVIDNGKGQENKASNRASTIIRFEGEELTILRQGEVII